MNTSSPQPPLSLDLHRSSPQNTIKTRVRSLARVNGRLAVWVALLGCGGMLGWLSVLRYRGYNASMLDLGNMAQAISSVARGRPLVTTFPDGSTSRLAVHVELIYYFLGWLYPLANDPRLLLVLQAALFASAALPVYAMTLRHSGSTFAAVCFALVYLLYPVAQTSVLFDFHGDTLAMPLLLFALNALDRRAWGRYAVYIALALACKFYVAVPVAVLGGVIWWCNGERKVGLLTTFAALAYGAFAFGVVRPFFTTSSTAQTHRGLNYLLYYFGQVDTLLTTWDQRLVAAVIVFMPALTLLRRGWRWALPGLPIAAVVLLSSNGSSFDFRFHHYALVVPFVIMAAIKGLAPRRDDKLASAARRTKRSSAARMAWQTLLIVALFNVALVNTPLNPLWWIGGPDWGMDPSSYGVGSRDAVKDRFLAQVPPRVPVAASVFLAPHIADRDTLFSVRYPEDRGGELLPGILPQVDYVVADALFDFRVLHGEQVVVGTGYERTEIGQVLRDPAFGLVSNRDGLLLFQRGATGPQVLHQQVEVIPDPRATGGPTIELAEANVVQLAPRRMRATFEWIAPETPQASLVAVSKLEGIADARIVHLPSYAMLPASQWEPGQRIRETFDIDIPADVAPGSYWWSVGWYDLRHGESYLTDEQSQVGPSVDVTTIEVTDD